MKKLTKEQYYKWEAQAEKVKNSTLLTQLETKIIQVKELEIRIKQLELEKQKNKVANISLSELKKKEQFKEIFIKELEEEIGFSLSNVSINPETLEVNELD